MLKTVIILTRRLIIKLCLRSKRIELYQKLIVPVGISVKASICWEQKRKTEKGTDIGYNIVLLRWIIDLWQEFLGTLQKKKGTKIISFEERRTTISVKKKSILLSKYIYPFKK